MTEIKVLPRDARTEYAKMAPQRRFPMSLYALGLNHSTAPLNVREQVAFSPDALGHALRDLMRRPAVKEAAILSTCNRTELYVHSPEPSPVVALARGFPPRAEGLAVAVHLHAAAGPGGDACLPRGVRPRFDGAGRAADPGANEAGGSARRIRGDAGARAEPALPAHVRRGEGRAHANRHRQRVDLDGGRVGQARRADLPVDRRAASS